MEERKKRLEERKRQRKEDRRNTYYREKEEEEQRIHEESLKKGKQPLFARVHGDRETCHNKGRVALHVPQETDAYKEKKIKDTGRSGQLWLIGCIELLPNIKFSFCQLHIHGN